MNEQTQPLGLVEGLTNEAYHRGQGISKSQLDLVHKSPSLLEWNRKAPEDPEAKAAVNIGSAFEALLLEPERFAREYLEGPKNAPRNTKAGKEVWAEVEEKARKSGATILTNDEWRQIHLMRDSTLAHPVARRALRANAKLQASYYWHENFTGSELLCRCRPDWMLAETPFVIDVKTTGDIKRFAASVEDYRYHVQDAFYVDGLTHYYGEPPVFAFLVVSTSRDAARYPVRVFELDVDDRQAGRQQYRDDLLIYQRCLRENDWIHVEPLERPFWARRRDYE